MTIRVNVPISDLQEGDRVTALISYNGHRATMQGIVWRTRWGSLCLGGYHLAAEFIEQIDLVSPSPRPEPPVGSVVKCDGVCGESFVRFRSQSSGWIRIGDEVGPTSATWLEVNTANGCPGHIETVYAPS